MEEEDKKNIPEVWKAMAEATKKKCERFQFAVCVRAVKLLGQICQIKFY